VNIEERADAPARINGYAALHYDGTPDTEYVLWDGAIERIMPGAFAEAIANDDVRALFNHDPDNILGRTSAGTLTLTTDAKGLHYDITPPDTDIGQRVKDAVKRRDVQGSSFAFMTIEDNWRKMKGEDGKEMKIRELVKAKLYDVGPVTYPAYEHTTAAVHSAGDADEARASMERWEKGQAQSRARRAQIAAFAQVVEMDEDEAHAV